MIEITMIKIFWGDSEYNIIRNAGRGEYTIVGKAKSDISSLINTIESLEINKEQDATQYANLRALYYEMEREIEQKDALIVSQKEEIERLLALVAEKEDKLSDYFDQEGDK